MEHIPRVCSSHSQVAVEHDWRCDRDLAARDIRRLSCRVATYLIEANFYGLTMVLDTENGDVLRSQLAAGNAQHP